MGFLVMRGLRLCWKKVIKTNEEPADVEMALMNIMHHEWKLGEKG